MQSLRGERLFVNAHVNSLGPAGENARHSENATGRRRRSEDRCISVGTACQTKSYASDVGAGAGGEEAPMRSGEKATQASMRRVVVVNFLQGHGVVAGHQVPHDFQTHAGRTSGPEEGANIPRGERELA